MSVDKIVGAVQVMVVWKYDGFNKLCNTKYNS